ncbi:neprilysin-3-like isoform X2 [Portunus trituberculatus]|nr:neprilysin-3-like isoform X2 [Portunus trituberculatus]
MSPAHDALRTLDKFQVGKPFDSSKWDLTSALLQLLQINGAPVFDIVVDSDVKEVGKFSIVITSPRNFGLISRLVRHPLQRRSKKNLHKFVRERGRRMLFGNKDEAAAVREALAKHGPVLRAGRDTHTRHALQRDAVGNLVSVGDLKEEEDTTTTTFESSSTSSSTSSTSTTTTIPLTTTSQATTTATTTGLPSTTSTTTTTTTTTTITTNTTTKEEEKGEEEGEPFWMSVASVSRRIVYRLFKDDMEEKRLESLASTLHDAFPNASLLSSSSSSSSPSPSSSSSSSSSDGEVPDDIYSDVITHFLPILQKLLPSEREELETQQSGKQYNLFTISALHQLCPVIDWSVLLGGLLNLTVTDEHNIYVHYPDHLSKLCTLLDNTEPWVIHYALLTLYSYDVLQETVYATEGTNREDFCLQAVKSVFGEVMSNLYLHHIGNDTLENIKTKASSLMDILREEVEESVSGSAWLGQEDKEKVLERLHSMKLKVGAREKHWDIEFVNKSHAELSFPLNGSFLHTVLELYRAFRYQLYQLHHTPMESDDFIWSFTVQPYMVDAFYAVDINSVVFPEAFFHPPFHRHNAPHYINFGSTATSIAHEIFHALDFLGIQFDERGLLTRPFSQAMVERLNITSDCYHNLLTENFFEVRYMHHTLIALEIDEVITKNENIADISGIHTAFKSYRRWEEAQGVEPRLPALPLNPHQLFFVSAAQPYCSVSTMVGNILLMELDEHLPNKLRINGMMKNMPEFSQVFSCPPTSKMFSDQTCHLF